MGKKTKKSDLLRFNFENAKGKIIKRNIAEQSEKWQKVCGANKNLYRYFPSLIDGLKPVQRRFLYMMYLNGYHYKNDVKLSIAQSDTIHLHPHADQGISEVAVGMAKPWENNACILTVPANIGSQSGSREAAPRYLEASISNFGYECYFENFKNSCVEMKRAYTGKMDEPEYLPSKYPIAIINGGFSGIGYGAASNIPMFNFKEVCEAAIALMDDPHAKICIAPDSPSGADVVMTKKQIKELFETGDSKLLMRAVPEIDYVNNIITFSAIPIQVTTKMIDVAITQFRIAGKFSEIVKTEDHTSEINGVYYEVYLQPNADPEKVLEKLFKAKTYLSKGYSAQITLIDDYAEDIYSVRRYLTSWLAYRRDTLRASFNTELISLKEDQHINEIKLFIFGGSNGERTISIAKGSTTKAEYVDALVSEYGITSLQAATIADLPTSSWTQAAYQGFLDKKDVLSKRIAEDENILEYDDTIDLVIKQQLKDGIKKYGEERRSKIVSPDDKIIENMEVVIGVSDDGYIKKINKKDPIIGPISKTPGVSNMLIPANNTDSLFIFDDSGIMHTLQINSIHLGKSTTAGVSVVRYIGMDKNAKIVSVVLAPKSGTTSTKDYTLVLVSNNGYAKRLNIQSIVGAKKALSPSTRVIALSDGDNLASVATTAGDTKDIIIFTNIGDGIRLDLQDIPTQLPNSRGAKVLSLRSTENVIGMNLIKPNDNYLVYATSSGKVKRTELKYFPAMSRKDELLPLVALDDKETLVSIKSILGGEKLRFHKKISEPEVLDSENIPLTSRVAKATKMLKTPKGDSVLSVVVL